jgi:hypothetical protein
MEDRFRDALGRFRAENEKRAEQQEKQRRSAENELLHDAVTMKEYNAHRDAIPHLVFEPHRLPEEMTMSDYMKLRSRKMYAWTHESYAAAVKGRK